MMRKIIKRCILPFRWRREAADRSTWSGCRNGKPEAGVDSSQEIQVSKPDQDFC